MENYDRGIKKNHRNIQGCSLFLPHSDHLDQVVLHIFPMLADNTFPPRGK